MLQQDNVPAHSVLPIEIFIAKYSIPELDNIPYLPDNTLWDFYVYSKVKLVCVLKELTEDLKHCFRQWKIHMEDCRDREEYTAVDG